MCWRSTGEVDPPHEKCERVFRDVSCLRSSWLLNLARETAVLKRTSHLLAETDAQQLLIWFFWWSTPILERVALSMSQSKGFASLGSQIQLVFARMCRISSFLDEQPKYLWGRMKLCGSKWHCVIISGCIGCLPLEDGHWEIWTVTELYSPNVRIHL